MRDGMISPVLNTGISVSYEKIWKEYMFNMGGVTNVPTQNAYIFMCYFESNVTNMCNS